MSTKLHWNCFRGAFLVTLGVFVISATCAAQPGPPLRVDVYRAVTQDISPPLREIARTVVTIPGPAQAVFLGRIPFTEGLPDRPDGAAQTVGNGSPSIALAGLGFAGLGVGFPGFTVQYAPPDTNAAVGATQIVQWVNTSFAIFSKAGSLLQGPTPGKALWKGFGGGCEANNDGDPIVQYDKLAGRWIFTQFSVSTRPYLQCFAVSLSSDATGPYFRFAYSFGNTDFPDYPKLGVWPDGYYLSFNIFRNGFFFSGPRACAVDRLAALSSSPPTMLCYQLSSGYGSLLPADLDGLTPPPAATSAMFTAFATNALQVFNFRPNFASPASSSFTGPTTLPVNSFTPACNGGTCIPQPSPGGKLDSLGDRLMYRLAYRNRGSGLESLVVNHSVKTSSPSGISGVRWYELRINNGRPSVYQQSTWAPGDGISRWMGSIAMDKCGSIALGYSASSGSVYPSIRLTARQTGDTANLMQPETLVQVGGGSQGNGLNRWGDYSSMAVDPADDKTFWYTTEYLTYNGSFNWSTRIVPFTVGACN